MNETASLEPKKVGRGRPPLGDQALVPFALRMKKSMRDAVESAAAEDGIEPREFARIAIQEKLSGRPAAP